MSHIIEIIDERERQKTETERSKGVAQASYRDSVRAKWFCCVFKLGFVQLIRKASLIFKPNLKLPLSIILKEIELYESKHVVVACRCLKICNLLSF